MLLDTICNSRVYHHNAYYLLGLYVGMTGRKLKRRIEDLQSGQFRNLTQKEVQALLRLCTKKEY